MSLGSDLLQVSVTSLTWRRTALLSTLALRSVEGSAKTSQIIFVRHFLKGIQGYTLLSTLSISLSRFSFILSKNIYFFLIQFFVSPWSDWRPDSRSGRRERVAGEPQPGGEEDRGCRQYT